MEFPLISDQTLTFSAGESGRNATDFVRKASARLEKFPNFGVGIKVCEERIDSGDRTQGTPGQLNVDLNKSLTVQINKLNASPQGCLTVWASKSNVDCYATLKKASGGKLFVDIKFELGTSTGNCKINEKKVEMFQQDYNYHIPEPTGMALLFAKRFIFTDSVLSGIWRDDGNTFTGKLSVDLKLDETHLGEILLLSGEEENPLLEVNKRMQKDTKFTDATIVPGNKEGIKCHRSVLSANSDYFQKMFETKMKEGVTGTVNIPDMSFEGVQALLDYMYRRDITKASDSASLALELLMKAGEYAMDNLEKAMLKLIHVKGSDWFPVDVAIKLFQFAGNKSVNEGQLIYQLVKHKAAVVLKSKSKKEIEECPEFIEALQNGKSGVEPSTYLMFNV